MRAYNLDKGWKFHRGEPGENSVKNHEYSYSSVKSGKATGPAAEFFGDSVWREVDLPHDYIAESEMHGDCVHSHGYRVADNAWYRKTFLLDEALKGKQLLICFEGTAVNAEFYFNGSLIARSFSAYTETVFDVTERAYFGERRNVLSVHINGYASEGWWYEGSGIYRHVKLYAKDKMHIAHNGVFVKPEKISDKLWNVNIRTTVENSYIAESKSAAVKATLYSGNEIIATAQSEETVIPQDTVKDVYCSFNVENPKLWDVDEPNLYTVKTETVCEGRVTDSETTRIGFRTFTCDKDNGFFLNGRSIKLKGTCNHQDHAGVGVAVPDSVNYYRIQRLKEMGTNAYRCSHNVPTKEILDYCDELGLLVMDENRRFEASAETIENVKSMVKRDCNHPSVVFYSLFNEEPLQNTPEGVNIYLKLRSTVLKLDDSRIIMGAVNGTANGVGEKMDAFGLNYGLRQNKDGTYDFANFREQYPNLCVFGSENNSAVTTRGCYKTDRDKRVLGNYDDETVPWGQTVEETWSFVRSHNWFGGIFIWTGFDYRGEPTPFAWPCVSSQFGIMDTCGFAKDSFYFNKACFTSEPMVHLMPHWCFKDGESVRVKAVTNCEEAEVFLNGRSLGRKKADVCAQPEWLVDFVPGELSVKAYNNGVCVATDRQITASQPKKIKAELYRDYTYNDGADALILNVCAVDENGNEVPTADNHIYLEVEGNATFLGGGNGNPQSHELDNLPERDLFAGKCQFIIRTNEDAGEITLRVKSDGLEEAVITPRILTREKPNYIYSIENGVLSGFTMSKPSETPLDPHDLPDDNDMNSFAPVDLFASDFIPTYKTGYLIIRNKTVLPEKKSSRYTMIIEHTRMNNVEIYFNGKLAHSAQAKDMYIPDELSFEFDGNGGDKLDIVILIYNRKENPYNAGIKGAVRIL